MADPIRAFSDAELERMLARAYREAARCWQEARSYMGKDKEVGRFLDHSAVEAQNYWQHLRNEKDRREERAVSAPQR
jgi:hypothetical protein